MAVTPGRAIQGVFITTGNPDTANDAPTTLTNITYDLSGQLGAVVRSADGTREWMYVKMDSGAVPTPAANQLVFWKTRGSFLVTTKSADAAGGAAKGINEVCGIVRSAVTVGNYFFMLRKGSAIPVKYGGAGAAAGDLVFAKTASAVADADSIAGGTAATAILVGTAVAASGGGNVSTDVDVE